MENEKIIRYEKLYQEAMEKFVSIEFNKLTVVS